MQMLEFNMVTKSDFESFQKSDFESFKKSTSYEFVKVNKRIEGLEERLTYEIHKLSLQLTVKLGVMLATSVGLISKIIALKF